MRVVRNLAAVLKLLAAAFAMLTRLLADNAKHIKSLAEALGRNRRP